VTPQRIAGSGPDPASDSLLESLVRRDRLVATLAIALLTVLAWIYLLWLAGGMRGMPMEGATPSLRPWTIADGLTMLVMWAVMMVAMMLPSASPMILLHATISRQQGSTGPAPSTTAMFACGYVLAWTGFSAVATALQWGLERLALLSPMMVSTSGYLGGALLIAAGLYQMTELKEVCLTHCRSPIHFITMHWRQGTWGAFRMGLAHGAYCVGCCWILMALLFVGGVMNLLWIAALAAFVLAEKVLPHGALIGRAAGGLMLVAGGWLLATA